MIEKSQFLNWESLSDFVKSHREEELLNHVMLRLNLLKKLFKFNKIESPVIKEAIMEMLTIVQYGENRFPYMIVFQIENGLPVDVSLHPDPHYTKEQSDTLIRPKPFITYVQEISRRNNLIDRVLNGFVSRPGTEYIGIGGTKDRFLVIGIPKKDFLNKHPKLNRVRLIK